MVICDQFQINLSYSQSDINFHFKLLGAELVYPSNFPSVRMKYEREKSMVWFQMFAMLGVENQFQGQITLPLFNMSINCNNLV